MTGWYDTCDPQLGPDAYATLIRSDRDAENTAGRWLHRLGYTDAVLTAAGHDNGIDVRSAGAVAQVKRWRTKPVGIRDVQRLAGAAEPGQTCLFFASHGYTAAAKAWAERSDQRVALFIMRDNGSLVALNQWAYLALCDAPIRWWCPTRPCTPLTAKDFGWLVVLLALVLAMAWTLVAAWWTNGAPRTGLFMAALFTVIPVVLILSSLTVIFESLGQAAAVLARCPRTRTFVPVKEALQLLPPPAPNGAAPEQFPGIYLDRTSRRLYRREQAAARRRSDRRRASSRRLRRKSAIIT
ncbi:restriction endonuclease [Actinoplanes sp. NBRC 103695]|uniref:restriction endonuclease n=1 Tax=Actinoplanes sp. NBRC 103695 TaxID=3032202 RepID=UPI002556B222|nr:restriction endonuclease [Actinoplanes sp. NBRC 103695]